MLTDPNYRNLYGQVSAQQGYAKAQREAGGTGDWVTGLAEATYKGSLQKGATISIPEATIAISNLAAITGGKERPTEAQVTQLVMAGRMTPGGVQSTIQNANTMIGQAGFLPSVAAGAAYMQGAQMPESQASRTQAFLGMASPYYQQLGYSAPRIWQQAEREAPRFADQTQLQLWGSRNLNQQTMGFPTFGAAISEGYAGPAGALINRGMNVPSERLFPGAPAGRQTTENLLQQGLGEGAGRLTGNQTAALTTDPEIETKLRAFVEGKISGADLQTFFQQRQGALGMAGGPADGHPTRLRPNCWNNVTPVRTHKRWIGGAVTAMRPARFKTLYPIWNQRRCWIWSSAMRLQVSRPVKPPGRPT